MLGQSFAVGVGQAVMVSGPGPHGDFEDPPTSCFGANTLELVLLTRSEPRIATLRMT